MNNLLRYGLLALAALLTLTITPARLHAEGATPPTTPDTRTLAGMRALFYPDGLPPRYTPRITDGSRPLALPSYYLMRQGNDSNCDFIAFTNITVNIGGNDPTDAFRFSRQFVPQDARDYREVYYTKLGPNGSDQPFTPNNLGAAPEAFVGAYEAYGYNTAMMAAAPGEASPQLIQALYDRLVQDPGRVAAHIWINAPNYDPATLFRNTITVPETGEQVRLPFPYHEVMAVAAPDAPGEIVILDGVVGYPYTISLQDLTQRVRAFNRFIVVSRNDGSIADHQRAQMLQMGQPFVDHPLGGLYLRTARGLWGANYLQWGNLIAPPMRMPDADADTVVAFSEYVAFERTVLSHDVQLAPLGWRMAYDIGGTGWISGDSIRVRGDSELRPEMMTWIDATFGGADTFYRAFGRPITDEFWASPDMVKNVILQGIAHPAVDSGLADGYSVVVTERAVVAWHPATGAFLLPLGRIYHEQLKQELF